MNIFIFYFFIMDNQIIKEPNIEYKNLLNLFLFFNFYKENIYFFSKIIHSTYIFKNGK